MPFRLSSLRRFATHKCAPSSPERLASVRAWLEAEGLVERRRGVYASIHALPSEPSQVLKVFSLDGASGRATWAYLKAVSLYDNPLFPQVHRMARVQDVALVWLERLCENGDLSVAAQASEALTGYFDEETQKVRAFGRQDVPAGRWHKGQLALKQLVEACEVLTDIIEEWPECDADVHEGNFMVRQRPGGGQQLVLTDPLA